jgi:hypothetical protein
MVIAIWELIDSRSQTIGTNPSLERLYFLTGESDDALVRAFLNTSLAANIGGLWLDTYDLEPVEDASYWRVTANYIARGDKEDSTTSTSPLDRRVRFSGGNVTGKIYDALATQDFYPNPGAPDHGTSINVVGDEVQGADIIIPNATFSETHETPIANITDAEIFRLMGLQGKINSDVFRGGKIKECLFISFDIAWNGEETADITYNFGFSPQKLNFNIGPIVGIDKEGFEFLWVSYATETSDGIVKRTPLAVYVSQVYEDTSFANLFISQV